MLRTYILPLWGLFIAIMWAQVPNKVMTTGELICLILALVSAVGLVGYWITYTIRRVGNWKMSMHLDTNLKW